MTTFTTFTGIAFTNDRRATHTIAVDGAGNVRVWDSVAGHFTNYHALSDAQCARLVKKARREAIGTVAGYRQFHA